MSTEPAAPGSPSSVLWEGRGPTPDEETGPGADSRSTRSTRPTGLTAAQEGTCAHLARAASAAAAPGGAQEGSEDTRRRVTWVRAVTKAAGPPVDHTCAHGFQAPQRRPRMWFWKTSQERSLHTGAGGQVAMPPKLTRKPVPRARRVDLGCFLLPLAKARDRRKQAAGWGVHREAETPDHRHTAELGPKSSRLPPGEAPTHSHHAQPVVPALASNQSPARVGRSLYPAIPIGLLFLS